MNDFYERYADYDGIDTSVFINIEGVSAYNSNFLVGLKRGNRSCNDLLYAESDDDNITEYYHVIGCSCRHIGYGLTSEGILHLSEDTLT